MQSERIIDENDDLIIACARTLGLIGNRETALKHIDYILPLGGARMSNLRRPQLAKKIIDEKNLSSIKVVALSGMRPLAESEMSGYIDTYAPVAKFEFDAISRGIELAFELKDDYNEDKYEAKNPNASYVIRQYSQNYKEDCILYSIAAPSTQPEIRRANSADCFDFFFNRFQIKAGTTLLNCTSQIYTTYQQVRALFWTVHHNVIFDTVGFPFALNNPGTELNKNQLSKPVNYLQEIKGTIDAMWDFVKEFRG